MKLSALILLLVFGAEALANNYFIPNYYRHRRVANDFAAIGWSDRHEANLALYQQKIEVKEASVKVSKTDISGFAGAFFNRFTNNVNLEVGVETNEEKFRDPITPNKRDREYTDYQVGVGYEMAEKPLAFGVQIRDTGYDDVYPTTTRKYSYKYLNLGAGYRLDQNIFVGIGYGNQIYDPSSGATDTDQVYHLGGGKVWGDLKKPDAAMEAKINFGRNDQGEVTSVLAKGLLNVEATQYYTQLMHTKTQTHNGLDNARNVLEVGVDHPIGTFYVNPQISVVGQKFSGNSSEDNYLYYSIEVGTRFETFEAYLRYNGYRATYDYPSSSTSDDQKIRSNAYVVGASYFF